ncbi:MAG TPA: tripartite tricarboxylate transporter substrate-binding protein, partial [Gemmatimonadaceae bacterium]|nr:tripartite tricarboxylate transporter substrate-binding protein [Gemmatimonadaceae bacterium]
PEVVARALIASAALDERYVPYAELSSAVRDLGEGRMDMLVTALPTLAVARGAGRVHVVAVATAQRSPAAPDVPTLREVGFPTLAVEGPQGLFGGRGLDTALRRRIAVDVAHVMSEPALVARLAQMGFAAAPTTPDGFAAAIAAQRERVHAFLALAGGAQRLRR